MKGLKRVLALMICTVMVMGIVPALNVGAAETENYSGTCGDDLTWSLENGVLTISGTGAMESWSKAAAVPWYEYRTTVKSVTIEDTVTSIGNFAFYDCSALTDITIPKSGSSIGSSAFYKCTGLTSVYITDVAAWCTIAFKSSSSNPLYYGANLYLNGILTDEIVIPTGVTSIGAYAFYNYSTLKSITIPDGVTSIGTYAFYNCSSLTSVTIPKGVTSIGTYAFYKCSGLTSIAIPIGVTSIGNSTFYGCSSLTSVIISVGITSIGDSAFYYCSALTSITIPDGVTSIGNYAFYKCSSLTSITIPASVTSIGVSAFNYCMALNEVNYGGSEDDWFSIDIGTGNSYLSDASGYHTDSCGDNLTWKLNANAGILTISGSGDMEDYSSSGQTPWYSYRSDIKSVVISDGVTSIGVYAFSYCSNLASVTIPDSVTHIGNNAFSGCSSLECIAIPGSVTSIGNSAFSSCSGMTSLTIDSGVMNIGDSAFSGCRSLTNVIIPGSVATIEGEAFRSCSSLNEVTILDGVKAIGTYVFADCSALTNITIPDSITVIGVGAFYKCTALTSVNIPEGVETIESSTFYGCSGLTSVVIPSSVTAIGSTAFSGCTNLAEIDFPSNVESMERNVFNNTAYYNDESNWENGALYIGNWLIDAKSSAATGDIAVKSGTIGIVPYAFYSCSALTGITIPDSVKFLGDHTFASCTGLTSAVIGNSVTSIGEETFYKCTHLTSVTIGSSVESIEDEAFRGDDRLTEVIIPDSVTSIGYAAFYQCSSMKTISIGKNVTEIEMYAFDYCSSLTSVILPEGVTRINQNLFSNCTKLAEMQLGDNVTYIGYEAFYNCTSLTSIEIPDKVTEIGHYAFKNCSKLASITLPDSVEAIHKQAFAGTAYYKDESNLDDGLLYLGNWLIRADSAVEDVEIKFGTIGIADYTFSGCDSMSSVKIPESVIYIGNYSFEGRSSMEDLEIPGSVKIIGWYAFSGCSGLRNVTIAYGVTEIGQYAFNGCSVLYNVEIPDSVTAIGSGAFTSTPTWMRVYYLNSQEKWQEIDGWDTTKITGTIYYGISGISIEKYEDESYVDEFDSLYVGDSIKLTVEVMVENGTALSFEKGNWTCSDADAVEFGILSASGAVVMENNDNYSIYTVSVTAELENVGEFEIEFNSPNNVSSSGSITVEDDNYLKLCVDTNSFIHHAIPYTISNDSYKNQLYKDSLPRVLKYTAVIKSFLDGEERGVCHGIALSMCYGTQGYLDFDNIISGASNYWELGDPLDTIQDTSEFRDMLVYYTLSVYTKNGAPTKTVDKTGWHITSLESRLKSFLEDFVNEAMASQKQRKPFVLGFNETDGGGHSVVVCGYEWNDDENCHEIKIYDENCYYPGVMDIEYYTMTVSVDYSSFDFADANGRYSGYALQDVWTSLKYYGIDKIYNDISTLSVEETSGETTEIQVTYGKKFRLENGNGEWLQYDGSDYTGTMTVYDCFTDGLEDNIYWNITVDASDSFTLTQMDTDCEFSCEMDGQEYICSGGGAESIALTGDAIKFMGDDYDLNVILRAQDCDMVEITAKASGNVSVSTAGENFVISAEDKCEDVEISAYNYFEKETQSMSASFETMAISQAGNITEVIFQGGDAAEIISISAVRTDDAVAVTAEYLNPNNGKIYAAGYADGKMLAMTEMTDAAALLPKETEKVKVFIWKSIENMLPLCEAAESDVREAVTED